MQIVHEVVEIKRRHVTTATLAFAEEDVFSASFRGRGFRAVQTACHGIQLRSRRKIEHVLRLSHMADANPIQNIRSFLQSVNCVAVEVCGTLLELGEVLNGAKAAFRSMNLLIEHAAQAGGVQAKPPLLRPDVRREMKLSG